MSELLPLPNVESSLEPYLIITTECNTRIKHPTEASIENSTNSTIQETGSNSDVSTSEPTVTPRCNPSRDRQPPARYRDYVASTVRYHPDKFLKYHRLSQPHSTYLTTFQLFMNPGIFEKQAQKQFGGNL